MLLIQLKIAVVRLSETQWDEVRYSPVLRSKGKERCNFCISAQS